MRSEMLATIEKYNHTNRPEDPMTKAWDDTQSQVLLIISIVFSMTAATFLILECCVINFQYHS